MPHDMFVPVRLAESIVTHAVRWSCKQTAKDLNAPQILALVGPSGCGKTTGAMQVLERLGVHVERIPASAMGGEYEGQATGPLRDAYITASRQEGAWASAVFIEEFDLSAARVDDNASGTVNGPLICAQIMTLGDNPFELRVSRAGKPTSVFSVERPPFIIMTANDPSKIYEPITRPGRSTIVEWSLRPAELVETLTPLYPSCSTDDLERLVAQFPDRHIAFFAQLGNRVIDRHLCDALRDTPLNRIRNLPLSKVTERMRKAKASLRLEELIDAAESLAAITGDKSYLRAASSSQPAEHV